MELTAQDIATLVNGHLSGDSTGILTGAAGLAEAKRSDVSFLKDKKKGHNEELFLRSQAGVILVPKGTEVGSKTVIEVDEPLWAFSKVLEVIQKEKFPSRSGIHASAVVAPSAKLGKDVFVGPSCVVEDGAVLGDNVTLQAQVYIGPRVQIGAGSFLYPQVVIREDCSVGKQCIIHAGVIIGSDGYGYFLSEGRHQKIPQVGRVVVEDDVEIGANTTIDRATTGATYIRRGAKIDNLVQIAHNVDVGEHSLLVAQVGIAGSTKLGKYVVLAGQVGVADHVTIGDRVQVGAQSGIKDDVNSGEIIWGSPAIPIQDKIKEIIYLKRLGSLFKRESKS